MTEQKKHLTKSDRFKVMLRSQLLQGSWNYERMQNGGWAYSLIPALHAGRALAQQPGTIDAGRAVEPGWRRGIRPDSGRPQ